MRKLFTDEVYLAWFSALESYHKYKIAKHEYKITKAKGNYLKRISHGSN